VGIKDKLNTMVLQGARLTPSLYLVGARDDAPPTTTRLTASSAENWLITTPKLIKNCVPFFLFFSPESNLQNLNACSNCRMLAISLLPHSQNALSDELVIAFLLNVWHVDGAFAQANIRKKQGFSSHHMV
jgi:hypothetical protein